MGNWTPERHERFEHIKTRHRMGHEQELIEMLDDALREIERLERTAALWKKTVDEGEEILHAAEARVKELEEESKLNADHMLEQRRLLRQHYADALNDVDVENTRLRKALEKHANHESFCFDRYVHTGDCSCGLLVKLAELGCETQDEKLKKIERLRELGE